jgi:Flp pilus assembly protein TadG
MFLLKHLRSDDLGAAAIEFTLALPVLLLLGLGIFEFGSVLYGHHLVNTGLHDAARFLARLDDPLASGTAAKELAVYGAIGGSSKRVAWWNTSDVSITLATISNPINPATGSRTYRGTDPLRIVRVSTTTTYPGLGFLNYLSLGSALTFNLYHEERVIGE